MMDIPVGLEPEIVPLSWLIGQWHGDGMVEYQVDGETRLHPFHQRVEFRDDGLGGLAYSARAELMRDEAAEQAETSDRDALGETSGVNDTASEHAHSQPLNEEVGFWRIARERNAGDVGPGMLPATEPKHFNDVDAVESLRNADDAFPLEVVIAHPTGLAEQYAGTIAGPRIQLETTGVLTPEGAPTFTSATRMYGLVGGRLFWAWDIEALGTELQTHASAQLDRVAEEPSDSAAE